MGTARLANRRSIRKKGWNYVAAGCYFVTMNTHQNRAVFGAIVNGRVVLSEAGRVAEGEWRKGAALRKGIELDEFVIMPNHVHGIVRLKGLGAPSPVPGHIRAAGGRGVGDAGGGVQGGGVARDASAGVDSSRPPGLASQLLGCDCSGRAGAGGLPGGLSLKSGEAILSGFLSPMEREVFKNGLARRWPLIWVKPWGLEDGAGSAPVRRALEEGHLLALSPFADDVDVPNVRRAAWCNQYVLAHCDRLVVGHLNPGGLLVCALSEVNPEKEILFL